MEYREANQYSVELSASGVAPADFNGATAATVAAAYASLEALKAVAGTVFVEAQGQDDHRPLRFTLTMAINGVTGKKAAEDVYLVFEEIIDGAKQLSLAKLGNAVYTASAKAVGGTRNATHKRSSGVVWSGTNLSKMNGGGEDTAYGFDDGVQIAGVEVFDVGNAIGLLRVPYLPGSDNPGTSCAPMHMRWR